MTMEVTMTASDGGKPTRPDDNTDRCPRCQRTWEDILNTDKRPDWLDQNTVRSFTALAKHTEQCKGGDHDD